jgi:GT2 family glycosyltransferase
MSLPLPELDMSVVTFNSAHWMRGFLDSLARQNYPASLIHLWIRDNGSTAEQYERTRAELDGYAGRFAAVHMERGPNIGFGAGHNRNFPRGQAALFLVTNVDLEFEPAAISRAVAALRSDAAAVACRELRQQPYEHPKHYHPATLDTAWCSSACVLFRREAFAAARGYDERIFLYGEDVDLSYRLRELGYALKYCPAAVCIHHAYARPGAIKPDQFFGSATANFLLRLRFGSWLEVAVGCLLQASLWLRRPWSHGYYGRLARSQWRMLRAAQHFVATRRRTRAGFPFRFWRYGWQREGAFYATPRGPSPAPLVSLIVRTHAGRLGWLREATACVVNQTYPRIELIVVEDGPASARPEIEALDRSGWVEAVRYLSIEKGGRSRAGNAGLAAARGSILGFLDDDDLLYADHVETLVAELCATPECAAVYGLAAEVPTRRTTNEPFRYQERGPALVHNRPFLRASLLRGNFLPIQTVLFRRECYERHGGFDAGLEALEDWDLWLRYSADGAFRRVEKVTSLYRIPADVDQLLARATALEGHRDRVIRRHGGRAPAWRPGPRSVRWCMKGLPFLRGLYLPGRRMAAWLRRTGPGGP